MADPNSYKDPYWSSLASNAEQKVGIPSGLLVGVLTRGEKSNADQVSEAGARTPFQIIPSTRQAIIKKYGIDPYLNAENAAEGAALLLKESLDRNKGNPFAAVAEYHGGTDRKQWGPRTRAYVDRVMSDPKAKTPGADLETGQKSTFQTVMEQNPQYKRDTGFDSKIAKVYQAYKAGEMTPDDAKQFETDVKSGTLMLPRGASLNGEAGGSVEPKVLPKSVTDAYVNNKMTDKERADLEADMKSGLVKLTPTSASQIPTEAENWVPPTEQGIIAKEKPPSLGDRILGASSAGLSTATGLTGGALGMAGGTAKGIAQSILDGSFGTQEAVRMVEGEALKGAQALTYEPRTALGQQYAKNVGDVMQQAIPLAPMAGEVGAIGAGLEAAKPLASQAARSAVAATKEGAGAALEAVKPPITQAVQAVKNAPGRAMEMVGAREPVTPTAGTAPSVGAAGTDVAAMRRASAQELPVPIEMTKGQATRDFGQLRFEQEAAKNPELGAPIRERMAEQQKAVRQSFDVFVDETGTKAPDSRAVGISVDKALREKAARDKAEIRVAYKNAEKAGETSAPVSVKAVVDVLNESSPAESTAPVLTAAKKELLRLGGAVEDASGNLIPQEITLGNAEQLRKFVNKVTGADPTNIKFAADIKRAIDTSTEGVGGQFYKQARDLRSRYGQQYENHAVVSDLLNTKRGSSDRIVALEDVADRIIYRGSLDDMRTARKVLQTGGEEGIQAWKDVQGQAIRDIRDAATKNVARDAYGNEVISPAALDKAIKRLDSEGKLDYLFGKKGAEKLRILNDVSKDIFTTPPGSVNNSNTASVLLAAMDMAVSSSAGLPLPVMSGIRMLAKNIKDRKLKARINEALGK